MNIEPLVTVYIPTFNRLELLKRALTSVTNQSYKNLEIIVVDDNSSDGTREFLELAKEKDDRVSYIFKNNNSGACVSRNLAIEKAKGLYITGLDDDDYFTMDRIEKLVKKAYLLDKYVFLYTSFLTIVKGGGYKKVRLLNFLLPKTITKEELLYKNIIGNQCFTFTQRLKDAGKFSPEMPAWQDMDLFYRLLSYSSLKEALLLNEPLYYQDTSHDKDRITSSNKNKIHKAYELFCKRNNIDNIERDILRTQLVSYGIKVDYYPLFFRFLKNKNLYFMLINIFLILKNVNNKEVNILK